jgi:hypothetical protein
MAAAVGRRHRRLFKGSAVKRAKYEGLMRNIRALQEPHGLTAKSGYAANSESVASTMRRVSKTMIFIL